jgi:hypothetical protein
MAATSYNGNIYMMAGSNNPYNYSAIGYDGKPAPASDHVWRFSGDKNEWQILSPVEVKSMDHRGLLEHSGVLYRIGGIDNSQQVSANVLGYEVEK